MKVAARRSAADGGCRHKARSHVHAVAVGRRMAQPGSSRTGHGALCLGDVDQLAHGRAHHVLLDTVEIVFHREQRVKAHNTCCWQR